MGELGKQFIVFCKKNRLLWLFNMIVAAAIFGCRILSKNLSFDTDTVLVNPNSALNWLQIGRWGLVLILKVFHVQWFNQYIAGVMTFLLIILFLQLFSFFLYYVNERETLNYYVFCSLFITSPVFAFQWVFQLQEVGISWSICLVACSLILTFWWIREKARGALVLSFICMLLSFSCYETNVLLYIAGTLLGYLMTDKERNTKENRAACYKLFLSFLAAFILNSLISTIFFTSSDYLLESINWNNNSIIICVLNVLSAVKTIIFESEFTAVSFLLTIVLWFGYLLLKIKAGRRNSIFELFVWIAFFTVPFAPIIVTGGTLLYRNLYVVPFVTASAFTIFLSKCGKNGFWKRIRWILLAFATIISIYQSQTTLRLWYTDDIRYDQDCRMISRIVNDIEDKGYDTTKPIAFIGVWEAPLNPSCFKKSEILGVSYFDMYTEYRPFYSISTGSIVKLAIANGYQLTAANTQQIAQARELATKMKPYPDREYIQEVNGVIIVKVGEDIYP